MAAQYQDYYQILQVDRKASTDDIQRAYRKLAREYHPDVNKTPDAEKKFKQISEAYEVLKDEQKRKLYDQLGSNWKDGQDFRPPPGWAGAGAGGRGGARSRSASARPGGVPDGFETGGADFSEFFESLFGQGRGGMGGFSGMDGFEGQGFGGMGGGSGTRTRRPRQGASHEAEITISLADAFQRATRSVGLTWTDENGQQTSKTYDVKVPAGVADGSVIRLAGQGAPGIAGGPPGDLLITLRFAPDPSFRVEAGSSNLFTTLPITPWEAALGAKVPVRTLDQEVVIAVPAGSQSGQKLRIRSKGLPMKSGEHADLLVELKIVVPKTVTDQERALFEELGKVSNFSPRGA